MRKLPRSNRWRVANKVTGKVYAYRSTYANARKQLRLLNALKYKDTV